MVKNLSIVIIKINVFVVIATLDLRKSIDMGNNATTSNPLNHAASHSNHLIGNVDNGSIHSLKDIPD
jgi:hypothetical protein